MSQEKGNKEFHDSESEYVYDLYNACNGEMHNGALDIRKLDKLSEEEKAILDVPRLRKLGAHIASGCNRCEAIINTLNFARGVLRNSTEQSPLKRLQTVDVSNID